MDRACLLNDFAFEILSEATVSGRHFLIVDAIIAMAKIEVVIIVGGRRVHVIESVIGGSNGRGGGGGALFGIHRGIGRVGERGGGGGERTFFKC
ncbi:hypothetical protein TIFTF001_041186 [Ficus carica]|uniref:Uncharacterized protein n=1 Tax=Ficus carica TaxID=3494 RepID=A0AA87Z2C4_FICCA|nr:hypothetical protein TIFTF001_041186 [Ficus carica]